MPDHTVSPSMSMDDNMTSSPKGMTVFDEKSLGHRIIDSAHELGKFTETDGMLTRTYMTPAHHQAAAYLAGLMCNAGMRVRRDNVGNVIGRYEGTEPNAKVLLTGSHFDTVRNAGMFDGPLGILLPIACVHRWNQLGRRFPYAIEVIGFSEEEGVRFKATLLGSRGVSGTFDMSVLKNKNDEGQTMEEVMAASGFHVAGIPKAAYDPSTILGYVEVHIEQGPVLLDENLPLGVVTTISGATRFIVEVTGTGGHAGTVPMEMRHDAAMAAAEIGLFIENRCSNIPTLVGTVGQLNVPNGATNVIPEKAIFTIDIRAAEDEVRCSAVADVVAKCAQMAQERGVTINAKKTHEAVSVPCAQWLQKQLAAALERRGQPVRYLPSGAGHDAMAVASMTDVAMLFVRCGNGGISHNPLETMTAEDAQAAAELFSDFVENFQPQH